ncbi:hypothetical protein CEUSTIGMA_g3807.t1 [Chlamydomonas eustigma]|uniref:NADH dehydrogenase subunit 4L n=1 Tax=Chlamydomonas eustigma TaxID=1157962 RepID=A0A250WZV3_9CHLO|nr:hypothetical protein CEUSTIGMA_g3807.t1 [Chlamydomonas eustigma]|eukprot:GAX76361.1 hypothetical protein CEUSTIGMA_g3807.t1 [Chlamydomonas eustigma]
MSVQKLLRLIPKGIVHSFHHQTGAVSSTQSATESLFRAWSRNFHSEGAESYSPSIATSYSIGQPKDLDTVSERDNSHRRVSCLSMPEIQRARQALGLTSLVQPTAESTSFTPNSLAYRPSLFNHVPVKGFRLGLQQRQLAPRGLNAVQNRSYHISEGELLGSAYLMTTEIMFWSGLIGAVVFRRNIIVMLLCTEIVMLACNMNFLFAAAYLNDMTGVIMSITITTIAACETAIGLALCVTYFHIRSATDVEALNLLK